MEDPTTRATRTARAVRRAASCAIVVACLAAVEPASAGRFAVEASRAGATSWLAVEAPYLIRGAGTSFLVESLHGGTAGFRAFADGPVDDGALHAGRLFLVRPDRIEVRAPESPDAVLDVLPLPDVERDGPLRVAFAVDLLVVGHGEGLLVFDAPFEHRQANGAHRRFDRRPDLLGRLATAGPVRAIESDGAGAWIAVGARLLYVDLSVPDAPAVRRTVAIPLPARAVAAEGDRLYWVDDEGLYASDATGAARQGPFRDVRGAKIEAAGRELRIAAGAAGLRRVVDRTARAVIIPVNVSNFAFSPSTVQAQVGDTVRWSNQSGVHNVEACDGVADPGQCPSTATEAFSSGAPTSQLFVFNHTFDASGANPFFCAVHVGLGMSGVVNVAGAPVPPPVVPDGGAGVPLQVTKQDPAGSTLDLTWDAGTCTGQEDHQLIYGFGAGLPSEPGGTFDVAGAACSTGAGGAFTWFGSPDPDADPDGLLWFLPVATDGATTEGGWGTGSGGSARGSAAADGNSGQCGVDTRDPTDRCAR